MKNTLEAAIEMWRWWKMDGNEYKQRSVGLSKGDEIFTKQFRIETMAYDRSNAMKNSVVSYW